MSLAVGNEMETLAHEFLLTQGLTLIEKNFSCKMGEIDLIYKDKSHLVFVEVRYRQNNLYGGALESITREKQRKILKTAQFYIYRHKWAQSLQPRIDVVAITSKTDSPNIEWIKSAIEG